MFFTKAKSNQKISRYVYMVKSRRNRKRQTRRRGGSWRDSLRNRGFYKMVTGDKDVLPELREQFRQQCKNDLEKYREENKLEKGKDETTFQDERVQQFFHDNKRNPMILAKVNYDTGRPEEVFLNADTLCGKDDDKEDNIAMNSQYRSTASKYMSRKFRNRIEEAMKKKERNQHFEDYITGRTNQPIRASDLLHHVKKSWRNS
jgi:hypothetical protein